MQPVHIVIVIPCTVITLLIRSDSSVPIKSLVCTQLQLSQRLCIAARSIPDPTVSPTRITRLQLPRYDCSVDSQRLMSCSARLAVISSVFCSCLARNLPRRDTTFVGSKQPSSARHNVSRLETAFLGTAHCDCRSVSPRQNIIVRS